MFKKTLTDYAHLTNATPANAAVSAKRFEAVDDLIERCEAISHQVANQSTGIGQIAA